MKAIVVRVVVSSLAVAFAACGGNGSSVGNSGVDKSGGGGAGGGGGGGSGSGSGSGGSTADDGVNTEVATSVVSGAVNVSAGSSVAMNLPWNLAPRPRFLDRVWEELSPVGRASAATWTCTGASLAPTFDGPGTYALTPASCSIAYDNGKTGSSSWSTTFSLDYGSSCDDTHARPWLQAASCSATRTTATGGNIRTIVGPDGNSYSITHDTNGQGSGWDDSVTPSPTNAGVIAACGSGGCTTGGTLTISGSHLTGTETLVGGSPTRIWDHTVTTGTGGLTVTMSGGVPSISGTVTVQHNLAKYTSSVDFNDVTYGDGTCCFPTSGTVTDTFSSGPNAGKSDTLSFSGTCGESTLTLPDGTKNPITLIHCI
jgi:hypothetical protein